MSLRPPSLPDHPPRRGRRSTAPAVAVALATLLLVGVVAVAPAAADPVYPTDRVTVVGRGYGHGRGLGQYGALGYAVDHGWTHGRILDHFYGGTTRGTQANGVISVHLTRHDDRDLLVRSANAFRIGTNDIPAGSAGRVHRLDDGRWQIFRGAGCSGPWTLVQEVGADARPEATTSYGGDDRSRMLNLCDGSTTTPYRGSLMIRFDAGHTRVGNIIQMERYLRGVVPRESPASWGDLGGGRGMEALKAQAVAARSYAWTEARSPYRTCDTVSCQVYGGAGGEDPRTDAAVTGTAEQVRRRSSGSIARTEFSSSTGGWSAGGDFPAVVDDGDDITLNPHRRWTADLGADDIGRAFGVGPLVDVRVTRRNGLGADGGRVLEVRVAGRNGTATVTGLSFRMTLGLRSDWFTLSPAWPFTDIAGTTHARAIAVLHREGIVRGCTATTYCPANKVTREQMAALLDRALALPPTDQDFFDDDAASPHQASINRVAAAGIAEGTRPRRFSPKATVTREQMATFLTRGFSLPPSSVNPFTDLVGSSPHTPSVRAVAAAGIARGCTPTRFCPGDTVTRGQMATFLARALHLV
jgi:hypothetical protein